MRIFLIHFSPCVYFSRKNTNKVHEYRVSVNVHYWSIVRGGLGKCESEAERKRLKAILSVYMDYLKKKESKQSKS